MSSKTESYNSTHVPVIIGNYAPFRLVLRNGDRWKPTLNQINERKYDYVKLSRLSCFIDIGIAPFSLGIGFDGSLILPATKDFKTRQQALNKFNETLGILLLGGVYSEAIQPTDISYGSLYIKGYIKNHGGGTGQHSTFHHAIRTKYVSTIESINLMNPLKIKSKAFEKAYIKGKKHSLLLGNLSPSLYLNGVSNFVREQWVEALLFLWTAIEQLINTIWEDKIIKAAQSNIDIIAGRTTFLSDYRTWSTSTRIELLHQKGFLGIKEYQLLNIARKSRNDFIHSGKTITEEKAEPALLALFRIMSLMISDYKNVNKLEANLQMIFKNRRGGLYPEKKSYSMDEVSHWLALPELPGDPLWGNKKFQVFDDLLLKPMKNTE